MNVSVFNEHLLRDRAGDKSVLSNTFNLCQAEKQVWGLDFQLGVYMWVNCVDVLPSLIF